MKSPRPYASLALNAKRILVAFLVGIMLAFFLFPIFWMISTSVKPEVEYLASPPVYIPRQPTLNNFVDAYEFYLFPSLFNSLLVAFGSTLISVFIGALAAYGFSRLRIRGANHWLFWILSTRMFPPIVVAIPVFLTFRGLRMLDTQLGLIFIYVMFNLPFIVWVMTSFFRDVPIEVEESAMVDGCSRFGVFFKIALPLVLPGIVAVTILAFIFSWNEFFFSLVLTRTNAKTLPVVLAGLYAVWGIDWGHVTSVSVCVVVPIIIFAFLVQRRIVEGMSFGAIKG